MFVCFLIWRVALVSPQMLSLPHPSQQSRLPPQEAWDYKRKPLPPANRGSHPSRLGRDSNLGPHIEKWSREGRRFRHDGKAHCLVCFSDPVARLDLEAAGVLERHILYRQLVSFPDAVLFVGSRKSATKFQRQSQNFQNRKRAQFSRLGGCKFGSRVLQCAESDVNCRIHSPMHYFYLCYAKEVSLHGYTTTYHTTCVSARWWPI